MLPAGHRRLLQFYQRLPTRGRRWVVRSLAPSYTVGSMCLVERSDRRVLLVRHTYRRNWGVPGGLLKRRERPDTAAIRETREEVGITVVLIGPPAVVVDAVPQRVDVVYRAHPGDLAGVSRVRPCSPEITEVGWFGLDELPALQHETAEALRAMARQRLSGAPESDEVDVVSPDRNRSTGNDD